MGSSESAATAKSVVAPMSAVRLPTRRLSRVASGITSSAGATSAANRKVTAPSEPSE